MKAKIRFLRLLMILLLLAGAMAAWAQPYPTPGDESVCLNSTHNYGVTNTTGSTYAWSILPLTGGDGTITVNNPTNTISVLWTSVGTCTLQVIETNASGCELPPVTITITVNPIPDVNPVPSVVYCNGQTTVAIPFSGTVIGTTFNWTNSDPSIGLAASGSGDIVSFTATNLGLTPVVATITVTPTANGCVGIPITFTITVNPAAQVNDPADQVVCNGAQTAPVNFTTNNTGGTMTYSWANDNTSIGLAASGTGNIAGFTAINAGSTPVVATITVTPHFLNGGVTCDGPAQTFTITVNPAAQVNDPADQVVCNNALTAEVVFTTTGSGGTTTYSWDNDTPSIGLAASGTGDIPAFTAVNTGIAPVIATITVTPHFENGSTTCDGTPQTFTITVNPSAQVNDPADQVVCNNAMTADVVFTTTNTGGTMSYSWTNDTPSIGLASSGTGTIAGFLAINLGASPVVATITVTPHFLNGGVTCDGPAQTFTITVNPAAQVNDPADQVVCNNTMTAPVNFTTTNTGGTTTYSWVNDTPSIGLASSGNGDILAFTAINIGMTPVIATITVTPHFLNGGVTCNGPAQTFTITVNPSAQVNDPADQVVCNGAVTAPVNFTTNNTGGTMTYNWVNNTTSIGLAANGIGDIAAFTAINTGTSPVVATITVTPHFTNGSVTCDGVPQTFTITVNPTAQVNDPADQVVCNGAQTAPVNFTTNNSGGTMTYSWVNNNTSIGLAASGTGNIAAFTAINAGSTPVVATITVTPHFLNGGVTCDGPVQTFTITVNPAAQVNDPADQVVCNNALTAAVVFTTTGTGGTTTYTWVNDNTSIGLAATGTGDIAPFTAINAGITPVVATITVTPHFENGSTTCDGAPQTFTITVNPTAQVNDPADQVVCNGALTAPVTFTTNNTVGTTTYTWTNDNTSIGLAASGSGTIAAFTAINPGTAPVVATITVTPHFTNGGVTCDGPAQTFTITVNPAAQVNDPADQVVCNNSMTAAVTFTTNNTVGTTTYTWVNDTPSIGLAANGTGNIAAFTAVNAGIAPVVATITVTPHFENGSTTCDGTPQTFTITVNPSAQVNDPADQVVCNNALTADVVFTTTNTGGTMSYSWTNNTPSIGLAASGNGDILAFTALNTGTSPVVATITVTPHFTNGGVTCDGTPQTFTITVNPTAQVNDPADQVVCNGALTATVTFTTNTTGGTTTYSWSNDNTSIGLGANGTGDIAAFTAINTGTAPVIATITVTPHFANGGVTCDGPAQTFTITVNPSAQVNDPADQVVCNNAMTAEVVFTTNNTGGNMIYDWVNDTPSIGLAASGSGDIAAFTAINTGTSPVVATITVTPHFENGSTTCDGIPQTFTITVNPTAQVNDPADQVVCNNAQTAPVTFTTNNTVGTTTFSWVNDTPSIGLAANGNGNIPAFTAINTGTTPVVATITVTPHFLNGGVTCDGPAQTFTITVDPTTTVNPVSDAVYCDGATTAAIPFSSPVSGTTYAWTNSDPSIGLAASGTGDIPSFTATNTGTTPVVATITVTPSANGCTGNPITFTITVNPRPIPTIAGPTPVCQNSTDNIYTTETGMTNYVWTVTGGTITAGQGTASITVTWTTAGTQTITVTYTNVYGCNPISPTIYPVVVNEVIPTSPIFHN